MMIARLTKKLLRTNEGMFSPVSSGSTRNAATMRGRLSASAPAVAPM